MLAGSIGMLPSASLDANQKGLYEPIHGSAPDIAGQDKANPLATILSLAMMFRYTFARADVARAHRARRAQRAAAGTSHRRHRAAGRARSSARARWAMRWSRRCGAHDGDAATRDQGPPRRVARRGGDRRRPSRRRGRMAGTLQLPLPSVEMWRKRLAEFAPTTTCWWRRSTAKWSATSACTRRRVAAPQARGAIGMSVRDDWQRRGVGSALMVAALDIADNWLNYRASRAHRLHGQRRGARAVSQVRLRDRRHAQALRLSRRPLCRRLRDGAAARQPASSRPLTTKSTKTRSRGPSKAPRPRENGRLRDHRAVRIRVEISD